MDDLKQIKNKYGEEMAHLCRKLFPTILEENGLLFKLMSDHLPFSKVLYNDIINQNMIDNFRNYIYSLTDSKEKIENIINKTPNELLDEAGYILYECKTYEDINSFKYYYRPDERLCTFTDYKRLDSNYVFFAIKKDVDNIKRENIPNREDKYGTSVLSIQFTKGDINTLSIKNRYNHTVNNPDATFNNNLENIIPGLTNAFEKQYNLNINSNEKNFKLSGYVLACDNKYYKYNYEINNKYYCPNNIIIDNFEVKRYDKERYIIFDYFILDMKEKRIYLYDETIDDSFINSFNNINRIDIRKEKENKIITINDYNIEIVLDKNNKIIKYKNNDIICIDNNFLNYNKYLESIILENVIEIGNNFLYSNESLNKVMISKVKYIDYNFLCRNNSLKKIYLPNVESVGSNFLYENNKLKIIGLPKIKKLHEKFLFSNNTLEVLYFPNVIYIGSCSLIVNNSLKYIYSPNLEYLGYNALLSNKSLIDFYAPKLENDGSIKNSYLEQFIDNPKIKMLA